MYMHFILKFNNIFVMFYYVFIKLYNVFCEGKYISILLYYHKFLLHGSLLMRSDDS
jgi:hypothetical protein